jgi:hypothetical protein
LICGQGDNVDRLRFCWGKQMRKSQRLGYGPGSQSRFHLLGALLHKHSLFTLLILTEIQSNFFVVTDRVNIMPVFPVILVQWVLLLDRESTPSRL